MIHPATEIRFIDENIGYGVFATRPIPMGTVLWTLCHLDIILEPAQRDAMPEPYRPIIDKYSYYNSTGKLILCWDYGRFVNHSCDPVMLGVGEAFEIAVRDLEPGDELTCDYATLNLLEAMPCSCGQNGCCGSVESADLFTRCSGHDASVAAALQNARNVAQPLLAFAKEPDRFWAWADGREPIPHHEGYFYPRG